MMAKKPKPIIITVPSYPSAGRPLDEEEWNFVQKNMKRFNQASKKEKKKNEEEKK